MFCRGETGESTSFSGIPENLTIDGFLGKISFGSTVSDGRRIEGGGRFVCMLSGISTVGANKDKVGTDDLLVFFSLFSFFGPSDAARSSLMIGCWGSEGCRILMAGLLLPFALERSWVPALSRRLSKHLEGPSSKKSFREGRPVRIFVEAKSPFAPV
jgi:hypothetical protein